MFTTGSYHECFGVYNDKSKKIDEQKELFLYIDCDNGDKIKCPLYIKKNL